MRNPNSIVATVALGIAAIGLIAVPARATLIELDLNVAGDKLITRDTATHFEWLDVTATLGLSYQAAEATPFVATQGFRHATLLEVLALYDSVGISIISPAYTPSNFPGVQQLLSLMGCTGDCGPTGFNFQQGQSDSIPTDPTTAIMTYIEREPSATLAAAGCIDFASLCTIPKTLGVNLVGHYLIREVGAVPEPASLSTLVGGIILFAWLGCQRRRRAPWRVTAARTSKQG